MAEADEMICADCGVGMNRHAEKIDYAAALDDPEAADPAFGGVIDEAHTCPKCGQTEMRRVAAAASGD